MVPVSQLLELQRQLQAMTLERDMYKRLADYAREAIVEVLDNGPSS